MGIRSYFINRMEKAYWEDKKTLLDKYLKRMYVKKVIKGGCSYIGNPQGFKTKPVFPHGINGIFVSGDAVIGEECIIFQQVTIGSNSLPGSIHVGSPHVCANLNLGHLAH